jgi:hypothetical protein
MGASYSEFNFSFLFIKINAKGGRPCERAYVVALVLILVIGVPVGAGLGWGIATGNLSISSAVAKGLSYVSGPVKKECKAEQ